MQPKAIIAFLACLCLSIRADAFWNFGRIIRTTANTLEGVENLIHGTFGAFTAEELGFEEDADFKAKLIGVNALCMMGSHEGQREADQYCESFGTKYFHRSGNWGCGQINTQPGHWSCMFQSNDFVPEGLQVPEVVFRRDEWRVAARSYDGARCRTRIPIRKGPVHAPVSVGYDEIEISFPDSSHLFSSAIIGVADHYAATYDGLDKVSGQSNNIALSVIVEMLDIAGIRYPIGRNVCQLCKGTCNKIMGSQENKDACKYRACVGFLGGYKGDEDKPGCDELRLP